MADFLANHPPYARWAHVLLRVFVAALLLEHGFQKVFGAFGGMNGTGATAAVGSLFFTAGVIESIGGTLVLVGLFTRPAAFLISGEMATAYFMTSFPRGFWPIENHGELLVLFCFVFLYFAATGAGAVSLDYVRTRRRPHPIMS